MRIGNLYVCIICMYNLGSILVVCTSPMTSQHPSTLIEQTSKFHYRHRDDTPLRSAVFYLQHPGSSPRTGRSRSAGTRPRHWTGNSLWVERESWNSKREGHASTVKKGRDEKLIHRGWMWKAVGHRASEDAWLSLRMSRTSSTTSRSNRRAETASAPAPLPRNT